MYDRWSLDVFYKGVDDPKIEEDIAKLEALNEKYRNTVKAANYENPQATLRTIMELKEDILNTTNILYVYFRLRKSGNSSDKEGNPYRTRIQKLMSANAKEDVLFKNYVGGIDNIEEVIKSDDLLSEYGFYFSEIKSGLVHNMSSDGEYVFSQMAASGGLAWAEQYSYLMSHTEVDFRGEKKSMNALQALSKSADATVRKEVYEAQLANYPRITDALAYSVNNIKAQVLTETELRGFESPLDMTLASWRLKKETLEAMWSAVKESFPKYREYLKAKAKLLDYEKGLPWYDIYAPIGKATSKEYTPESAHKYLVEHFKAFSSDMSEMMDRAFKEEWIDFYSRAGKSGGAFCYNLTWFGESRILTNFNGNFGAINTLAHELGHAFHGQQVKNNRPLNRAYGLPLAETASTFNEILLMNGAINNAEGEEKIALLDKQITDSLMILPDMYVRYKTEDELIKRRKKEFVYAEEINKLMTDTQKEVYGDALDNDYLYPYVWCDKSHYYSSQRSYYNFPYAFGGLFGRGLYAKYAEMGESFVPKYRELLKATSTMSIEDAAMTMGIDLTAPEFWRKSLQTIYDSIDLFIEETKK
jgi:pepF/M3 family oligoendopeptidase